MSNLTNALERILDWWKKNGYEEAVSDLQPGLSYAEIEEMVKDLPLRLPLEVYELYQWRNGSRNDEGFYLSLQEAIAIYIDKLKSYDSSGMSEHIDVHSLKCFQIFPVNFEAEQVGYLVIQENPETCPVIFESIKNYDCIINKYASLTSMMLTFAECLETGVYERSEKGYLIWRKYNISIVEEALAKLENNLSIKSLGEIAVDLTLYKDSRAVEPLIQALQIPLAKISDPDENREIRNIAASLLGELGDSRAVEPLISALQDEYWMTRYWAAISLGKLGDLRAVEPLINALQDTEKDVRAMAVGSLKYLKAVDPLIQALKHNDGRVRMLAASSLGDLKDPRAVEPLSQLTEDEHEGVRKVATKALERIRNTV
jgi:hypothetical protein